MVQFWGSVLFAVFLGSGSFPSLACLHGSLLYCARCTVCTN